MKKSFTLFIIAVILLFPGKTIAGWHDTPYNRTFVKNNKEQLNYVKQQQLRNSMPWKLFVQRHADWSVIFDERSGMPHRAYGNGIKITSVGDAASKAMSFIQTEMTSFNISTDNLVLRSAHDSKKYQYVDYYQTYLGLEVLNSRVTVRMTKDDRVILYGADVFNDIAISISPQLSSDVISGYAVNGIAYEITGITVDPALKVLPVPASTNYDYRLVYEVTVSAKDLDGHPARYYTLVNANNGEVLYRHDQIDHLNDLLTAQATVSDPNPWEPTVMHQLPYLRVKINNTDYYTDAGGNLSLESISLPVSSTIYLQGTWSKVVTGNYGTNPPNFTQTLNAGANTVDFTSHATLQQRSAYYHVNVIHDYMKSFLPGYTEMDVSLITNVDRTDGSCNAYYDGSSINFFVQGAGCFPLSLAGDVVYHEYAHGIDGRWYSLYSNGLDNGGISEGYSDVWAIAITDNPILGIGISDFDPSAYVRRYDINKKVYPQDLAGESHADGEIICGAWYDTRLNLGSVDSMMILFAEALNGLADGPDGTEGTVYRDVLLDALAADDLDGNLSNGTPHHLQILKAFALHGITLMGTITLNHAEPLTAAAVVPVTIEANITQNFFVYFGGAYIHYKKNTEAVYDSVLMTYVSGSTYEANLPAQPVGTILDYFFTVEDIYGIRGFSKPARVQEDDPNLPYKLLINFQNTLQEDFDTYQGYWVMDDNTDDAESGEWIVESPNPSYITPGVPSSMVQTSTDHTPNNNLNLCAFTGNAEVIEGAGTNDCDAGRNTMYSPVYDLTAYTNPAISYYRWYSNDQGANPGNDPWRVYITNGDGSWKTLENTYTPDHGWRCMAFRVLDYISISNEVQLKFVASDSTMGSVDLEGQSLVEAAVDDLYLWNQADNVGMNEPASSIAIMVSPNPAAYNFMIKPDQPFKVDAPVQLLNVFGKTIYSNSLNRNSDQLVIPVKDLESGIYILRIVADKEEYTRKVVVQH